MISSVVYGASCVSLLVSLMPLPCRLDEGESPYKHSDCGARCRIETWFVFLDIIVQKIDERFSNERFKPVAYIENRWTVRKYRPETAELYTMISTTTF